MANEKMTTCKACGASVAKSAKTCPSCGAKLKKHRLLGALLIVIGLIILISVIGSLLGDDEAKPADNPNSTKTEFGIGEAAKLNDVVVTLVNVTESTGSTYNTPAEGNIFILCEFEIENGTSSDIAISSALSFECYCDDYATNYSIGALSEKGDKNQLDGTVAAGKKFNGVVGYEVPADWKEIELRFTPDFWSGKDIKFVATHTVEEG